MRSDTDTQIQTQLQKGAAAGASGHGLRGAETAGQLFLAPPNAGRPRLLARREARWTRRANH